MLVRSGKRQIRILGGRQRCLGPICYLHSCHGLHNEGGAMKRRLAQLAEESRPLKDDPLAGKVYFEKSAEDRTAATDDEDTREVIDEIYDRLAGSKFEYEHQKHIQYTHIPESAPKQVRDIAQAEPWTGQENLHDSVLRMLEDSHKPLRTGTVAPPKFSRPKSRSERLATAREISLDYTLSKHSDPEATPKKKEENSESGPSFKEMYKERLLGPSGIPSAFAAINSLASQRIDDAIARGQFRDIPRGHKVEHDHHLSSPYIDTTEYFLNKIIQRQGAAPPWIQKQVELNTKIEHFRNILKNQWQSRAVLILVADQRNVNRAVAQAKACADKEASGRKGLRDAEWEKEHRSYHELLVADLNSTIRGYNLQAPGSARKGYLELDAELESAFKAVAPELPAAVKRFLVPSETIVDAREPAAVARDQLHRQAQVYQEDPRNYYGVKDLLRDVFFRRKSS